MRVLCEDSCLVLWPSFLRICKGLICNLVWVTTEKGLEVDMKVLSGKDKIYSIFWKMKKQDFHWEKNERIDKHTHTKKKKKTHSKKHTTRKGSSQEK